MKKKEDEDFGTLITREMKAMLQDTTLTKEERFDIVYGIMFHIDTNERLLVSMINSFKAGYDKINKERIDFINSQRKRKAEWCRNKRNIDTNRSLSKSNDGEGSQKADITSKAKQSKAKQDIPPKSPKGVLGTQSENLPPEIDVEAIFAKGRAGTQKSDQASDAAGASCEPASASGDAGGEACESGEDLRREADYLADRIEETEAWPHAQVNRGKLRKCLVGIFKKNGGAASAEATGKKILDGLDAWTATWRDDWSYCPRRITDWLMDGMYLKQPFRERDDEPYESAGCGECGVFVG